MKPINTARRNILIHLPVYTVAVFCTSRSFASEKLPLKEGFKLLKFGSTTTSEAITLLGTPYSQIDEVYMGLEISELEWIFQESLLTRKIIYKARFISDRLVKRTIVN